MKAEELRIGNWVLVSGGVMLPSPLLPHQIVSRDIVDIDFNSLSDGCVVEPIPLTPEILERAGFEKMEDLSNKYEQRYHGNANLNFGYPVLFLNKKNKVYHLAQNCSEPNGFLFFNRYRIDCKYLHQLQNLYFALTGQELSINLQTKA